MAAIVPVRDVHLGFSIIFDSVKNKIIVDVDNNKGLKLNDTTGKVEVDLTTLGLISDDDGNIAKAGSDNGVLVTKDDIKDVVGEMVASATDGIDYDNLAKTLKAYLYSLATEDSDTIKWTTTDDADGDGKSGDFKLKADVKVNSSTDNAITVDSNGLMVDLGAKTEVDYTIDTTAGAEKSKIKVNGVEKSLDLEPIKDLSGNTIGYAFKA